MDIGKPRRTIRAEPVAPPVAIPAALPEERPASLPVPDREEPEPEVVEAG